MHFIDVKNENLYSYYLSYQFNINICSTCFVFQKSSSATHLPLGRIRYYKIHVLLKCRLHWRAEGYC